MFVALELFYLLYCLVDNFSESCLIHGYFCSSLANNLVLQLLETVNLPAKDLQSFCNQTILLFPKLVSLMATKESTIGGKVGRLKQNIWLFMETGDFERRRLLYLIRGRYFTPSSSSFQSRQLYFRKIFQSGVAIFKIRPLLK